MSLQPVSQPVTQKLSTDVSKISNEINANIKTLEDEMTKKQKQKKIALALAGLATAGIAAVGIACAIKKGKHIDTPIKPSSVPASPQVPVNVPSVGIKGLARGESLDFSRVKATADGKDYIFDKYTGAFDGKDVVVEVKNKAVFARTGLNEKLKQNNRFAIIRDLDTNELIAVKHLDSKDNEIPFVNIDKTKGAIHKTSQKLTDEAGNKIQKTFKNGKLFSTQTTELRPDGSKLIKIKYEDKKNKTVIHIAADGARKVIQDAHKNLANEEVFNF